MSESDYYLAFSLSPTIGPKRLLYLLDHFKSAKNAWQGTESEYEHAGVSGVWYAKFDEYRTQVVDSIKHNSDNLARIGVTFVSQIDQHYPKGLLELSNPPIGLYCKGDLKVLQFPKQIAIVGSRKITMYGQDVTRLFADVLATRGCTIISGLAMGVDAIAHAATVQAGGKTIAVLGNGVDMPYPRENSDLYTKIIGSGGLIVSEYPPGMQSVKGSFPARNRVIAALSQAVLVTEAGHKSGSLITADEAQKLGKKIFAIPGPITSEQSDGTAYLLQRGGILVVRPEELLDHLGVSANMKGDLKLDIESLGLEPDASKMLKLLHHDAMSMDALSKKMSLPISQISQIITGLELQGYVKDNGQGVFSMSPI